LQTLTALVQVVVLCSKREDGEDFLRSRKPSPVFLSLTTVQTLSAASHENRVKLDHGNLHIPMKIPIFVADGLPGSPVVCRWSARLSGGLQILSICKIRGDNLHRSLKEICRSSASAKPREKIYPDPSRKSARCQHQQKPGDNL
jgi:hypothetical protein